MRYLRGILIAGIAWLAAGCMQFEYGITLEDDLSGTADLDVEVDLERVAYMSAYIQNAFAGESGEPTAEQIEAAREEVLQEFHNEEDFSEEALREEIEPDLPEGVTLVSAMVVRDELLTTINMKLAFEHVDQLKDLKLGEEEEDDDEGGPIQTEPFDDLEIIDEGDYVIIRMDPIDPSEEMEDIPWVSDEMLVKLVEGFGVTFKVTSSFDVEEHNATKKDGETLIWKFNFETLKSGEAQGIYARLKR
jgi:hypothetical protein